MSDTMSPGKHLGDAGDADETAAVPAPLDPAPLDSTTPPPAPADDQPTVVVSSGSARREVVCPECGTTATIAVNRREAEDFCRRCDFPLFWTPSAIVLDTTTGSSADALRRLPGTAGRVSVGKIDCPHCQESNPVTETHCLRCQGDLHPVLPPAPAAPVVLAPPPEPEPAPPAKTPWWVWAGLALTLALLIALVLYLVL